MLFKFLFVPVLLMLSLDYLVVTTGSVRNGDIQDNLWDCLGGEQTQPDKPDALVCASTNLPYNDLNPIHIYHQMRKNPANGTFMSYLTEEEHVLAANGLTSKDAKQTKP